MAERGGRGLTFQNCFLWLFSDVTLPENSKQLIPSESGLLIPEPACINSGASVNSFQALNSSKDVFFDPLMLSSQGFSRDAPMSVFSVSPPNWPLSVSIDEALLLRLSSPDWPALSPTPPPPHPLP